MADEQIGIDLILNSGEAATSVRELKQSIRDMQSEALKAGAAGDEALANKFKAAAGAARDRMADLNKEINATQDAGTKLGAITGVARSIAGGFAGAAGAAALFGNSQKDVQEQLLKVQSAVALLSGIQEIADIKKNFNIAKTIVLKQAEIVQTNLQTTAESGGVIARNLATAAQWALNAAMNANPILLIITGVVALTAAVIAFTKESKTEVELLEAANKQRELQLKWMDAARERYKEERAMRSNGVRVLERELEVLKAQGASREKIYAKEKEILAQKIIDWEGEKAIILQRRNLTADEFNYSIDLRNKQKALQAGFIKESKDENAKKTEADKKQLEADLQAFFDIESADEQAKKERIAQSVLENNEARNARDAEDKEYNDKKDEDDKLAQQKKDKEEIAAAVDLRLKKIKQEEMLRDAKIGIAQSTLSSLASISKLIGLNGQAAINFQKTLALAQIGIDTATAISSMTKLSFSPTHPDNLVNPLSPYLKLASGLAVILGNMASAKALLSGSNASSPTTEIPSFASSSSTAPLTPSAPSIGNTSTTLTEQEQQKPVIVKAYVVESEMTNNQQHIKNIEQKATFP